VNIAALLAVIDKRRHLAAIEWECDCGRLIPLSVLRPAGGLPQVRPAGRNYAAAKLMAEVGLRVNEVCQLDLGDVKWDLGRFGKIHVRMGKGARGSGPRERMVPLINNARATLAWFVQDVWGHFDDDRTRAGAPLLPSERRNPDGSCARVGDEALRAALAGAAAVHLPDWPGRVAPHLLRHFCVGQLYAHGMDLVAIQEVLGHSWIVTTMN
jgi:integrase/recombinase XerD